MSDRYSLNARKHARAKKRIATVRLEIRAPTKTTVSTHQVWMRSVSSVQSRLGRRIRSAATVSVAIPRTARMPPIVNCTGGESLNHCIVPDFALRSLPVQGGLARRIKRRFRQLSARGGRHFGRILVRNPARRLAYPPVAGRPQVEPRPRGQPPRAGDQPTPGGSAGGERVSSAAGDRGQEMPSPSSKL